MKKKNRLKAIEASLCSIKKLTELIVKFRDERDWEQFHFVEQFKIKIHCNELLEVKISEGRLPHT